MKNTYCIMLLILCSITYAKADCYKESANKKKDYADCLTYAEYGSRNAQYNLGAMYYFGDGVNQDYDKAFNWYRKSAERGYVHAQYSLGFMYQMGHGTDQNYEKALKWYKKSAKQHNDDAQLILGYMYQIGLGVNQDYQEALKWYKKAADQENVDAQYNLGAMYSSGIGVTKDYVMSHMYLNVATANGDKKARVFRNVLAKIMTSTQIKQAKKLAFEWVDTH